MSYNRVYKLIDEFVSQAQQLEEQTSAVSPYNQYQKQREVLSEFSWDFSRKLGAIISELGGEFLVLKERKFDPKMLKMLAKVHKDLIEIKITINEQSPYDAAQKLVHYVLNRPTAPIIDNLDFLAKHHLKTTNEDFKESKFLVHPQMRSLDKLTALAQHLKLFMEAHPLLKPIEPVALPPLTPPVEQTPQPPRLKSEEAPGTSPGSPKGYGRS